MRRVYIGRRNTPEGIIEATTRRARGSYSTTRRCDLLHELEGTERVALKVRGRQGNLRNHQLQRFPEELLAFDFFRKRAPRMDKRVKDIDPEIMALLGEYDYTGSARDSQ